MPESFSTRQARAHLHAVSHSMPTADPEALYSLARQLHSLAGDAKDEGSQAQSTGLAINWVGPAQVKFQGGLRATVNVGTIAHDSLQSASASVKADGDKAAQALSDWAGELKQAEKAYQDALWWDKDGFGTQS